MKPSQVIKAANKLLAKPRSKRLLKPSSWKTLSNADKREAVLLDVMKQVIGNGYTPISDYQDSGLFEENIEYMLEKKINPTTQLQKILNKVENCEACKRGMQLLSAIRLGNRITVEQYSSNFFRNEEKILGDIIPRSESFEMENVFEGYSDNDSAFRRFYIKYKSYESKPKRVLTVAICLNAITYGVFSPKKWLS